MRKSTTYLPDINVWLALVAERHTHHPAAAHWFDQLNDEPVRFCRMTQMGLLRLLTNARVMGEDVLTQADAWKLYDQLREDPRIGFLHEPPGFESHWRMLSQRDTAAHRTWTDAYLLAFAKGRGVTAVTFDKDFSAPDLPTVTL